MAIRFKCTNCSHFLLVPDEHAGRKAKCPNCAQIIPIPAPSPAQPPAEPAIPPAAGPLEPSTAGPIPSLAKKRKPGQANSDQPSKQTQSPQDQGGPIPDLRSRKKAVILGLILAAILVLVVWQMNWFGSEDEPPITQPSETSTIVKVPTAKEEPTIAPEILRGQIVQLEQQLATLEKLLAAEPGDQALDASLARACQALDEFSTKIQGQPLAGTKFGQILSQNRKWLYEQVLARAKKMVDQYRFASAATLLKQALPLGLVAGISGNATLAIPEVSSRRGVGSAGRTDWREAQQDCKRFANGELLVRGLKGQVCLWIREEADELGQTQITLSLDTPAEPSGTARRQGSAPQKWQQKWAPVSEHLANIRKLQSQAESQQNVAQAGRLYATIGELEKRCMTFETLSPADLELMKQLARRKADYEVHEQLRVLIGRCRYGQALQLAQQLIKDNPSNPDNHHWLLRCYIESYNTKPLDMDLSVLLAHTQKIAELNKYDVPNNLLALNLGVIALPQGPGAPVYREFIRNRTSLLKRLAEYGGRYQPVIDWMQGESVDMVLQDFEYRPFLTGEPVDLVDSKGAIYTLYGRGGPPGRAALLLVRPEQDQEVQGLGLQMPSGQRYQLWNIYPSAKSSDLDASLPVSLSDPLIKPVLDLSQINASELAQQRSIPVVNSLSLLRCQQDNEGRRAGLTLRIPRAALDREQLGPEKSRQNPRSSRKATEADKFILISFDTEANASRTSVSSPYQPITCLVSSGWGKIAYFNDAKGDYLVGLNGERLYAERNELLRTLNAEAPNWYLALNVKAYPPQLQRRMKEYEQATAPKGSSRAGGESRLPARRDRLTVSEAASWLAGFGTLSWSGGGAARAALSPIIGRWVNWQGRSIVQLDGRIRDLEGAGLAEPIFYTAEAGADLLKDADSHYQRSLQAWPALAGELYRQTYQSRLFRLVGFTAAAGPRSGRKMDPTAIDVDKIYLRAEGLLTAGDSNQSIALYSDLIGFLSLGLQQAISKDLFSIGERPRGTGEFSGQPQPDLFPEQNLSSSGNQRARQTVRTSPKGLDVSPQEQFFTDADLLIKACLGRAVALEQAGLLSQARQALRQSSGRIRAYLLTELMEVIERTRARQLPVSPQLKEIEQDWLAIFQKKNDVGLSRALQGARGQVIDVPWPASSSSALTQPSKAPMSLAAWLDKENSDLSLLEPERLLVAAEFDWIRESIVPAQGELPNPSERADQIIELIQAYQNGAPADAATAAAMWRLGSFMAAMGYQAEAWDCLGQAGALYSQLALDLLPEVIEFRGHSGLSQQQHYYAYRVAALASLAEAAAISADEPIWAKCSMMLAAEVHAKLLQLQRSWSALALDAEESPAILTTAEHALRIVDDLSQAKAYAQPRMRFWWWYYPLEQPLDTGQKSAPPGTSSPRLGQYTKRPKLEYIEPKKRRIKPS